MSQALQLSLLPAKDGRPSKRARVLNPQLSEWAFLYTSTEKGNNSGIRFLMTLDHAQQWCDSDVSRGVLMGTKWAYFFTTVARYLEVTCPTVEPRLDIGGCYDNGEWDERIAALGLKKIDLVHCRRILGPLGVRVVDLPNVETEDAA